MNIPGYLIKATWQWATFSNLHTAYFYASTPREVIDTVCKLRGGIYWQMNNAKIGHGWFGRAILFCDFYVEKL